MTPSQVAKKVGCSPSTIKAWIKSGRLRATQVKTPSGGHHWMINALELKRFLREPKTEKRGWVLGCHRTSET